MENNNNFAERLNEALKHRNKRPIDLTNDAKLNKSLVSGYLNGKFEPKNDKIDVIAKYLNVSQLYLMGLQNEFGTYADVGNNGYFIFKFDENDTVEYVDKSDTYGDHNANLEYFSDKPELLEMYKDIYENETLQLLFDKTHDLEPEDLEAVLQHIQLIRKARGLE